MIAKDGRVVWLHNLVTVIREEGSPKTIRGFSIDVTKSKQNENELRNLSGRLINAQEEERRRVARELHDDLNQRMCPALNRAGTAGHDQATNRPGTTT